jgi:hypothetical protein
LEQGVAGANSVEPDYNEATNHVIMTTIGWIIMLVSVGGVTALFVWCLYRVLACTPEVEKLHGIDDIETPDTNEE